MFNIKHLIILQHSMLTVDLYRDFFLPVMLRVELAPILLNLTVSLTSIGSHWFTTTDQYPYTMQGFNFMWRHLVTMATISSRRKVLDARKSMMFLNWNIFIINVAFFYSPFDGLHEWSVRIHDWFQLMFRNHSSYDNL